MRLIDADEALEMFRKVYKETENLIHQGETQLDNLAEGFTETAHIIKYLTSTVDAVPVVRCRDCKYVKHWKNRNGISGLMCRNFAIDTNPEAFCSYGERKTDEQQI